MARADAGEPVKISISPWCPYICEDKAAPGVLVEVTAAALLAKDLDSSFTSLPWLRLMATIKSGAMDAVLGIAKSDAPDLIFPSHSIGFYQPCFYTQASSKWVYKDVSSLRHVRLSVLKGQTVNDQEVDDYIHDESTRRGAIDFLSTENYLTQHFRKLALGRVDVVLDDARVVSHHLQQTTQANQFKQVSCLKATPIWIGFSLVGKHSKAYAMAFDEGLNAIKKSGQLKLILKKYGIEETMF
ncbi:ABC transporter substrate-binding protein [Chitinimonas sp. BJB300]|uniref:substrate-binding periplasmic protein n=1 Tax=Chitinimonas sp. BJB300 TaxID=1559339 RepID=UPI001642A6CD|nr:transporter substrate-binding domain-containing protein [Chitinimonas sp. BJB300]